jgi:RhtB (resistance to homoserine/threonine) family protein
MEFFLAWFVLASVQLAATLSPGPAFAVAVRNALAYDRRTGLWLALGLGIGISAHIILALCGAAMLLSQSIFLFNLVKYTGAAYLVFISIKALLAEKGDTPLGQSIISNAVRNNKTPSNFKSLQIGILTNLLNPKAVIFFTAVFTQFISPQTPWPILLLYGSTCIIIEIGWFSILAFMLTHPRVKARFMGAAHWIKRVCGGLLIALGVRLALSKIS